MKSSSGASRRRPAQRAVLSAFIGLVSLGVLLAACGISFGAGTEETEIFKKLTIAGDFRPGGAVSLVLEYAQQYEVDVNVRCDLLDLDPEPTATPKSPPTATSTPGKHERPTVAPIPRRRPTPTNKLWDITDFVVQRNPEGGPVGEATPTPGSFEWRFNAPRRPGHYAVRCFTPADQNNVIIEDFTVTSATPTPPPTP